jgi:hypothetical protein
VIRWYATGTDIDDRVRAEERTRNENLALREQIDRDSMFEDIVGSSETLSNVLRQVRKVASSDFTILILGESGTGKELIARAIHKRSNRAERAFIGVNCAALPPSLIASELFGHEKGAFTGFNRGKKQRGGRRTEMGQTIERKTKHLSLKLSTRSSISVTTKQLNLIGLPTTSSIALISAWSRWLFNLIKSIPSTHRYEPGAVVAEADVVILHGDTRVSACLELDCGGQVRMKDGIFVEHWDVIQDEATRESSTSGLPIFGDKFGDQTLVLSDHVPGGIRGMRGRRPIAN